MESLLSWPLSRIEPEEGIGGRPAREGIRQRRLARTGWAHEGGRGARFGETGQVLEDLLGLTVLSVAVTVRSFHVSLADTSPPQFHVSCHVTPQRPAEWTQPRNHGSRVRCCA